MKETFQSTEGISVYKENGQFRMVLPTLDSVDLSMEEYTLWNSVGKGKTVDEINSEMRKIFPDMTQKEVNDMLGRLNETFLIHPVPHSKGQKAFLPEERLFNRNDKIKSALLRKYLIQADTSLQYVYFLPTEKETFSLDSLIGLLDEILPFVSRSPVIFFFDAERYVDSSSFKKIVGFIKSKMVHDSPVLVFETSSVPDEGVLVDSLHLLEASRYECLEMVTLKKRFFGEGVISSKKHRGFTNDDNLVLLLKTAAPEDTKRLEHLSQYYPRIRYGLSFTISKKGQTEEVEEFSENASIPIFLRFEDFTLIPYFFSYFLNRFEISFSEDDMYRIKEAFLKNYLPLSNCGAGKRKILLTADGTVYPCLPAVKEGYSIGHIEEGIENVIRGKVAEDLQNNISKRFEECRNKCSFAYFCGGCILENRCKLKLKILDKIAKERDCRE